MAVLAFMSSPVVVLAVEILGVFAGALVVGGLLRPAAAPAVRVATSVAALVGLIAIAGLWTSATALHGARYGLRANGAPADERCFTDGGYAAYLPFVRWIRARVPEGDMIALQALVDRPCWALSLLPRLVVDGDRPAPWLVVVGARPPAAPHFTVSVFAHGLFLVHRTS